MGDSAGGHMALMPHNFHAYDSMKASSTEALKRIRQIIDLHLGDEAEMVPQEHITRNISKHFKHVTIC